VDVDVLAGGSSWLDLVPSTSSKTSVCDADEVRVATQVAVEAAAASRSLSSRTFARAASVTSDPGGWG